MDFCKENTFKINFYFEISSNLKMQFKIKVRIKSGEKLGFICDILNSRDFKDFNQYFR